MRYIIHWKNRKSGVEGQTKKSVGEENAALIIELLAEQQPHNEYTLVPVEAVAEQVDPTLTPFFLLNPARENK